MLNKIGPKITPPALVVNQRSLCQGRITPIKCYVLRKLFSIGTHALREVTACTTGVGGVEASDTKGGVTLSQAAGSGKDRSKDKTNIWTQSFQSI
jgi:hypothetical protein